eukprot:162410-Alexandrium_andersonii.AAC.1
MFGSTWPTPPACDGTFPRSFSMVCSSFRSTVCTRTAIRPPAISVHSRTAGASSVALTRNPRPGARAASG